MTNDDAVMGIEQLAHEEHTLREAEGHRALTDDERKRLVWLEQRLDQCWDLLRQRRALIDAGDPTMPRCAASTRSSTTSSRRRRDSHRASFKGEPGLLPIEQPTRLAADIAIAVLDQRSIKGNAGQTVNVRAIDDDLVIFLE